MSKKQIIKRLLQIVIVLIGISFITFALTFMSPGDPVRNMYTATGVMPTEEMVQETREELGLNDPFLVQYTRWLKNCLKGDFGKSYSYRTSCSQIMADFETYINGHDPYAGYFCTFRYVVCHI